MTISTGIEENTKVVGLPTGYHLEQNYPNPFNPRTTIPFEVESGGFVRVAVYDLLGRQVDVVFEGRVSPGRYNVSWDAILCSTLYHG